MKRTPLFLIVSPLLIGLAMALCARQAGNLARAAQGVGFFFWLAVPVSALTRWVDAGLGCTDSRLWRAIQCAIMGAFAAGLVTLCGLLLVSFSSIFATREIAAFGVFDQPPLVVLTIFFIICGTSTGICSLLARDETLT
jgi:hypothetical protein